MPSNYFYGVGDFELFGKVLSTIPKEENPWINRCISPTNSWVASWNPHTRLKKTYFQSREKIASTKRLYMLSKCWCIEKVDVDLGSGACLASELKNPLGMFIALKQTTVFFSRSSKFDWKAVQELTGMLKFLILLIQVNMIMLIFD